MPQHDSEDAQPDLRLQDLRLHLIHCGAILMQRRLFIIERRRAGADTRADELALAELELKTLRFEEQYRICLERQPVTWRQRSQTKPSAEWPERAAEERFFDKTERKVPATISPASLGRALSGI
jgi:hypothetical protein